MPSLTPPLMPRALVCPLDGGWQSVVDAVLRRRGAPETGDVDALAPKLVELSKAYNAGLAGAPAATAVPLDARIAFSFARDVPKGAGAVRELIASGALVMPSGRALRIVDLGAGLGAMTWGIARALAEAARAAPHLHAASIEALLVDEDAGALAAAESIAREATALLGPGSPAAQASTSPPLPTLTIRTRKERLAVGMKLPEADVVVLGQVLSELDLALPAAGRVERHAALIRDLLLRVVAPGGALVIVEPALRDRSRHLHAVRDALALAGTTIFGPCLHAAACPVLAAPTDWCHEDLTVDLPSWLVPLARAAGLRWQRLTFAHLVLRRDGLCLAGELAASPGAAPRVHLRVISQLMATKGKSEVFACTDSGTRIRLRRLDRDATASGPGAEATSTWAALERGDVVTVRSESTPNAQDLEAPTAAEQPPAPIDERGRISPASRIDVWPSHQ